MVMRVSTRGIKGLKRALTRTGKKLSTYRVPYKRSAVFLDRWVQTNFKSEGGNVGGWKPFARGGRIVKGKLDSSAKLLQDTGRGRASFKAFATNDNAGIGSELEYMKAHNEGEGVPQRRILPLNSEINKDIKKIFDQYTKEELKKSFGV